MRGLRSYEMELIENWYAESGSESLKRPGKDAKAFVLEYRGVLVSTCSLIARRSGITWLGGLLVPQCYRGRGFGLSMLAGVLESLGDGSTELAAALVTTDPARSRFLATGFSDQGCEGLPLVTTGIAPYLEARKLGSEEIRNEKGNS